MTQIGKCDTCRSRKVKCDEAKPICGACSKKNRPCTYSYGKSIALIREDPNHFSAYGKAKSALVVSPLIASYIKANASSNSQSDLKLTSKKKATAGHGTFHTFALPSKNRRTVNIDPLTNGFRPVYPPTKSTIPCQPSDPYSLASRSMYLFGPRSWHHDALSMHGPWIDAIPPRVGSSLVLDAAVEYAINSYATYVDKSFTAHRKALLSRSKALRALRKAIEQYRGPPSYDIVLATKLHSYAELFVAEGTVSYTTHCVGLSALLRVGCANGLDREHHWSLVDNTYVDEVPDAIISGRPSVFDTSGYLSLTDPVSFSHHSSPLPEYQLDTVSVMHCWIQLPRLACLIRRCVAERDDTRARSSALCLAKSIWNLDPAPIIQSILESSSTYVAAHSYPEIRDIVEGTITFDSVRTLLLCSRYWSLRIYVSSMIQTLSANFPDICAAAKLPAVEVLQEAEIDAAKQIVRSLPQTKQFSQTLPLAPLRALGPLALSVGAWYRRVHLLTPKLELLDPTTEEYASCALDLERANRMEEWAIEQCNRIHDTWGVGRTGKDRFEALIPVMSGGEVPPWIPNKMEWEEAKRQLARQGIEV